MRNLAHNVEIEIRDFFAIHWENLCFPVVFVSVNILAIVFIAVTR